MAVSATLYIAASGLVNHQRRLDAIGGNLANINTVGYKTIRHEFASLLSQTLHPATAPTDTHGSVNPVNIGLGTTTSAINPIFKQGVLEGTGNTLDLAIDGNGFFIVQQGNQRMYTRFGSFYLDHTTDPNHRHLTVGEGLRVQGYMATDGVIRPGAPLADILIPALGDVLPGRVTTEVGLAGNLNTNEPPVNLMGTPTRNLALGGNLASGPVAVATQMFVDIAIQETDPAGNVVRSDKTGPSPVNVEFQFFPAGREADPNDPAILHDVYRWEARATDIRDAAGNPLLLYPTPGMPENAFTVRFYAADTPDGRHSAGEVVGNGMMRPGGAPASGSAVLPNGNTETVTWAVPDDFTLDVGRLCHLPSGAPGPDGLGVWSRDGSEKGWMPKVIQVYDEVTRFERVRLPNGDYGPSTAVRRIEPRTVTLEFRKDETGDRHTDWSWRASAGGDYGTLRFDSTGDLAEQTGTGASIRYDFSDVRQVAYESSLVATSQDGYVDGYLVDLSVDAYGKVFGSYSNDVTELLAQVALATFVNANGLQPLSSTLFAESGASGRASIGPPQSFGTGAGKIVSRYLEMSTVDATDQFTLLITTERGYQANSRAITTSDEMLRELLNLKR